ncbi:MAG: TonB-dependent receptor [Nitrospinae bacterium]|nr:TonB-dependent receptor [Nitrospinota bacterium]MBL7020143.1 TonB-dependent receptor [Nitrospinaceae bacterium]
MKLSFFKGGLGALVLLLSLSVGLASAEDQKSSEAPTTIEIVDDTETTRQQLLMEEISIIGSKFKITDIAGSAAYLDVQDIRQHGIDDVNRILRRVPGVNLRQEDGFGLFPNISLRGVDSARSSKVTIMEDGVLMAPAPYSAPSAYYSPTSGRMSGIEVLKGSSQVKYGPHTTGGAINFLSTPIPTTEKYYSKASFGSFNEVRNHSYFGNTTHTDAGKLGYVIEYFARSNSGFKELDTNTADLRGEADTGFRKQEPMIKMFYEPKSSLYQRFEAKFGYTNLDANESYLGLSTGDFINNPLRRYSASRFDEIESTHFRSSLRHFLEIDSDTSLVTTVYGNTFNRNWQKLDKVNGNNLSVALAGGSDLSVLKGEAAGTLSLRNNNRTYYSYGVDSNLTHNAEVGETKHKIELGLRYHYDQVRRNQWDETYTQDANGSITAVSVGGRGSQGNRLQGTHATTMNVQDAIKWKKFTFTPGVRFEYISASYNDFTAGTTSIINDGDRDYLVAVGGGSLKYDLFDSNGQDLDLFTGVHRGFSPPSPRSGIQNGLREETSVGYEIGARYKDAPRAFSTEAIFFLTDIDNLIVNSSVGGTGSGSTVNGGKVRNLGLELQASYDHGLAKNWIVQTPTYIAFTYTDATFREDVSSTDQESIFAGAKKGNNLPYIPEYVVSFGFGLIYKKFAVNFDANYTDEAFADGSNLGVQSNPETAQADERFGNIDEQFVVDAAVGYQINNKVRLFSNFKNITNSSYMVSRQPHGPRPGLPFSMMAGLEVSF